MLKRLQLTGHLAANNCLPKREPQKSLRWRGTAKYLPGQCPFLAGEITLSVGPVPKTKRCPQQGQGDGPLAWRGDAVPALAKDIICPSGQLLMDFKVCLMIARANCLNVLQGRCNF